MAKKQENKKGWIQRIKSFGHSLKKALFEGLGISGRKEYKQKGSRAKTSGRVGDGMMDATISSVRKRNAKVAGYDN